MCKDYLCKKCKLKEKYYKQNDNKNNINYNNDNTILVYEDVVGPYEKLIPDTSVVIFSLVSLVGIVTLLIK